MPPNRLHHPAIFHPYPYLSNKRAAVNRSAASIVDALGRPLRRAAPCEAGQIKPEFWISDKISGFAPSTVPAPCQHRGSTEKNHKILD